MTAIYEFPKRREARRARKAVASLHASGIDGLLPMQELIFRIQNKHHTIPPQQEEYLKQNGLLDEDGTMTEEIRREVLNFLS